MSCNLSYDKLCDYLCDKDSTVVSFRTPIFFLTENLWLQKEQYNWTPEGTCFKGQVKIRSFIWAFAGQQVFWNLNDVNILWSCFMGISFVFNGVMYLPLLEIVLNCLVCHSDLLQKEWCSNDIIIGSKLEKDFH